MGTTIRNKPPKKAREDVMKRKIDGQNVSVSLEVIDKETAERYLGTNIAVNRRLRVRKLEALCRSMTHGDFRFTGDPIRFNSDRRLIDGQHRLHAIVETDTKHTFIVVRGLSPEAMSVLDVGAARTLQDYLRIAEIEYAGQVGTAVNAATNMATAYAEDIDSIVPAQPTFPEAARWLEENPGIVEWVKLLEPHRKHPLRWRIGVSAPLMYAASLRVDDETVRGFIDEVTDLDSRILAEPGSPAIALRRWLTRAAEDPKGGTTGWLRQAAITIKAWNAWIAGDSVQALSWKRGGTSREKYPKMRDEDGNEIPMPGPAMELGPAMDTRYKKMKQRGAK
jgi:hypothetical protein